MTADEGDKMWGKSETRKAKKEEIRGESFHPLQFHARMTRGKLGNSKIANERDVG